MQVGDSPEANFIVSTILEAETLTPLLKKLQEEGRCVNVLYGIPLVPSQVDRLAQIAREIGQGTVAVMIDHPDQIDHIQRFYAVTNFPARVFLKIDTGYHRAGLPPAALNKHNLLEKLSAAERAGYADFLGVYSHSSLSYTGTTPEEAMGHLISEINGCKEALDHHLHLVPTKKQLIISVGATPQALSSQNLLQDAASSEAEALKSLLRNPDAQESSTRIKIELHAGVYPLLDMQQFSTKATKHSGIEEQEIAIGILAEVCSVYNDGERSTPEVLLAAGTLALGREPCPNYSGWGVISSWRQPNLPSNSRLIVGRISQEHSILCWENAEQKSEIQLSVGQTVKVFPNHACVAGAFYNWYFVVDSDQDPSAGTVVDVWARARGSDLTQQVLLSRSR
jgi:D-serine ammonia-lyase